MNPRFIALLLIILSSNSFAQKEGNTWCFGDSAGIVFNGGATFLPYTSVISRGSCASVSDSLGQLLFYVNNRTGNGTNSTIVWNKFNSIMDNGDTLKGEGLYNELTIVRKDISKYYLFSSCTVFPNNQGLYCSEIDISLNNGLGRVIMRDSVIASVKTADCLKTIRHGNGRDWWLISKISSSPLTQINRFNVYLISQAGISTPIVQDFGNATDGDLQKVYFNNSGSKLMHINVIGLMTEYDFDRCTGIISNPNIIFPEQTSVYDRNFWEGAYSPNDSFFYASTLWANASVTDTSRIIQYSLFAPDIAASADTIFEVKAPVLGGALRLAPDNKIYYACAYNWGFPIYPYPDSVYNQYNMNLGVINAPDSTGAACNFQPFSFYLGGKRTYVGLPNNPNYKLGRLIGSPCDTLTSISNSELINSTSELFAIYNSSWQTLFVNGKNIKGKDCLLEIFDMSSKRLYSMRKITESPYFTQDVVLNNLSAGIYVVSLQTEREKLTVKFMK